MIVKHFRSISQPKTMIRGSARRTPAQRARRIGLALTMTISAAALSACHPPHEVDSANKVNTASVTGAPTATPTTHDRDREYEQSLTHSSFDQVLADGPSANGKTGKALGDGNAEFVMLARIPTDTNQPRNADAQSAEAGIETPPVSEMMAPVHLGGSLIPGGDVFFIPSPVSGSTAIRATGKGMEAIVNAKGAILGMRGQEAPRVSNTGFQQGNFTGSLASPSGTITAFAFNVGDGAHPDKTVLQFIEPGKQFAPLTIDTFPTALTVCDDATVHWVESSDQGLQAVTQPIGSKQATKTPIEGLNQVAFGTFDCASGTLTAMNPSADDHVADVTVVTPGEPAKSAGTVEGYQFNADAHGGTGVGAVFVDHGKLYLYRADGQLVAWTFTPSGVTFGDIGHGPAINTKKAYPDNVNFGREFVTVLTYEGDPNPTAATLSAIPLFPGCKSLTPAPKTSFTDIFFPDNATVITYGNGCLSAK